MSVTSRSGWTSIVSLYDAGAAHTLAALLNDEGVSTQVTSESRLIGETLIWEVSVQDDTLERAHNLLEQSRFADAELEYLATGVLPGDGSK
jgi:hypothetical protein